VNELKHDLSASDVAALRQGAVRTNGEPGDEKAVLTTTFFVEHIGPGYIASKCTHMRDDESLSQASRCIRDKLTGVKDETLVDFIFKHTSIGLVSPIQANDANKIGADSISDVDALVDQLANGWDAFRVRHPESLGIVEYSHVGFDRTVEQALVYFGVQTGCFRGYGKYVLLFKTQGIWRVGSDLLAWLF
jgi:hypothetical protein